MKLSHNAHGSWQRPSAAVDDAYEAEVQRSTAKGERLYRLAQKRLAAAEARLARAQAQPRIKKHVLAELAATVEIRRAELDELRRMMTSSPASAQHRGHDSYRPVPVQHGIPI